MTNRPALIKAAQEHELADIFDLLAVRILYPPDDPAMNIARDIQDLYAYPERLESSYRHEWQRIARRVLSEHGFADHWRSDSENLKRFIDYLKREAIPRCIHSHQKIFRSLGEILEISSSKKTVSFPAPQRKQIERLIWPEREN